MRRVLLADGDEEVLAVLGHALADEGYDVVEARTGGEALEAVRIHRPNAVVLDIVLDGGGGLDVIRALRADMVGPILVLSSKNAEADRLIGLYSGADDYMGKPFSAREIVARVTAQLRRVDALLAPPPGPRITEFSGVQLHHDSRRTYVDGTEVALTPREFALFSHLIDHPGRVLPVDSLLREVWGRAPGEDANARSVSNTLKVHVYSLREKLARCPSAPVRITTVFKGGYRLDAVGDDTASASGLPHGRRVVSA